MNFRDPTVGVQDKDVHHLITQAYQAGGKYQWAREAAVNAIQADATWIRFGIEPQAFAARGVARRYIADNGIGMNEEDLRIFLSSFGGGGRTIGIGANFGQGFKSSCYEWNTYGIIVASWTAETPEGRMIWIYRDQSAKGTFWKLRDFQSGEGNDANFDDCIIPTELGDIGVDIAKLKTEEIEKAGHGTVFLFLGDGPGRDTMNGDYLQDETNRRGIVGYLNSRFIDVPEGVEISVENFEAATGSDARRSMTDVNGNEQHYARRAVKGVRQRIAKGAAHGRFIGSHGTGIEWYLTDGPDISNGDNGPKKPQIMVQYENEAYDVKSTTRDYRLFGIPDEVKDRVWLIIEPPRLTEGSTGWGVTPQASRGRLIAKGEMELPWDAWQEDFYSKMPREIRNAVNESRAGDAAGDVQSRRDRLKHVQSKFGSRWRPMALVESVRGHLPGNRVSDGTSSSTGGRPRGSAVPVPGQVEMTTTKQKHRDESGKWALRIEQVEVADNGTWPTSMVPVHADPFTIDAAAERAKAAAAAELETEVLEFIRECEAAGMPVNKREFDEHFAETRRREAARGALRELLGRGEVKRVQGERRSVRFHVATEARILPFTGAQERDSNA